MSRAHVYDPPPHLASVAHRHTCPRNGHEYPCYGPRHEHGSVRDCGSSASNCFAPPKKSQEKAS